VFRQLLSRLVPRRRRSRTVVTAACLALVVLIATDHIASAVAETRFAERLRCVADLPARPDVTVDGFPFLPQVVTGDYRGIDVIAHDLRRGEMRLATVRASLHDVVRSGPTVTIEAASAEAVIPFDALPSQLGERPATYGESGGLLVITTEATIGGRRLPITVLGVPVLDGGTLRVEPQEVEVLGVRRPAGKLLDRLGARDGVSRPLPDPPAGLEYRAAGVRPDGLTITATGRDLTIRADGPAAASAARRTADLTSEHCRPASMALPPEAVSHHVR
jgi:hypothetical protein